MKILWCTHSLAGFKPEVGGYYGCGWITSLLEQFANLDGIEIGIAFSMVKMQNLLLKIKSHIIQLHREKSVCWVK